MKSWIVLYCIALTLPAYGLPARGQTKPATHEPAGPATAEANKIFTMDELKSAFDEQQYRVVLQQINRIQPNKKILPDYGAYNLDMLKAESCLRLRMNSQALDAFAMAGKDAPNRPAAALASATALLLKRSTNLQYTPRHAVLAGPGSTAASGTAHSAAFDLTIAAPRPAALNALLGDEQSDVKAKSGAVEKGSSLLPIAALAKTLEDLEVLELAATGATEYVTQERTLLAGVAEKLMKASLAQMTISVHAIQGNAEKFVEFWLPVLDGSGRTEKHYKKRGLANTDMQQLRTIKGNAEMIPPAAKELAGHLHQEATVFEKITEDAQKLAAEAGDVLNADYTEIDPPGSPFNRNRR